MASFKVYSYSKCSTCRKALRWLDEREVEYENIDIVSKPPSKKELTSALALSGLPLSKLFNTSGQSYREGNWSERLKTASQSEAIDALAKDGKLIKRPFILGDGFALVGFDEKKYDERFAKKKR
jgi:arsenate reductase